MAEKTINVGLKWAVTHQYPDYVGLLEGLIVDKYHQLSYSATRCLKTYIQMRNPKSKEDWQHITDCLLRVLANTRLSDLIALSLEDPFQNYNQPV